MDEDDFQFKNVVDKNTVFYRAKAWLQTKNPNFYKYLKDMIGFQDIHDKRKDTKKDVLFMNENSANIDSVFNLKAKRSMRKFNFDTLKYAVIEGSSLTFLGLVKYNSAKDQFKMTEFTSVLSGGLREAKNCIMERISVLSSLSYESLWVATIFGGCALTISYIRRV